MTQDQNTYESATPSIEPVAQAAPQEKMIPASQVNQIVSGRVKEANEKGYNRALQETQSHYVRNPVAQDESNTSSQASSHGSQGSEAQIRSVLRAELDARDASQAKAQQEQAQKAESANLKNQMRQLDNSLVADIMKNKERFPDIVNNLASVGNFDSDPMVKYYAAGTESPAEMLNHLASNTRSYADVSALAHNPDAQQKLVNEIAATLKKNKEAAEVNIPAAPLSQVQSSLGSSSPGGKPSMKDLKAMFRG